MTIISFKHQFIFIRPVKMAGTSLEIALSRFCGEDDIISVFGFAKSNRLRAHHYGYPVRDKIRTGATSEEMDGHAPADKIMRLCGRHVFCRFLKIAVVRNPYDWVVSFYAWKNQRRLIGRSQEGVISDFRAWCLDTYRLDTYQAPRWRNRGQSTLTRPYDVVDFMIRFEHFEEDLTALSQRLGLQENIYDTFKKITEKSRVRPPWLTAQACFEGFPEGVEEIQRIHDVELETFGYDLPWCSGRSGRSGLSVPTERVKESL